MQHIPRIRDRVLREPAIDRAAGELRALAESSPSRHGNSDNRGTCSRAENPDAIADLPMLDVLTALDDIADDFVPGRYRIARTRQLAIDEVQVGATDAARRDFHEHFMVAERPQGRLLEIELPVAPIGARASARMVCTCDARLL